MQSPQNSSKFKLPKSPQSPTLPTPSKFKAPNSLKIQNSNLPIPSNSKLPTPSKFKSPKPLKMQIPQPPQNPNLPIPSNSKPPTPSKFKHTKLLSSKVRQYAYVNPASLTSFFPLSRTIRALSKFQMCRVCHGGCVVRLFRMKRRDSPPGRAQTGGHDDPTFVTSAP